jgi:hypothetical protein
MYSKAVYLDGTKKFEQIRQEYVEPVKQYATTNFTTVQIDNSLLKGWITQLEYDETIAYKSHVEPIV